MIRVTLVTKPDPIKLTKRQVRAKYDLLLRNRVLTDEDYELYLDTKAKCRDLHEKINRRFFRNDRDYALGDYSDSLLLGVIPSKTGKGNSKPLWEGL